jgi:hypothetical protein
MSDDFLLNQDFDWEAEDNIDLTPPPSGKHQVAKLQLHVVAVTKSFISGDFVSIPGVRGGQYDEQDEDGNKMLKGWKKGGKHKLFVLVATKWDKEGNSYQVVKQYPNVQSRNDQVHYLNEFVMPELKKLPDSHRQQLIGPGIYVGFDNLDTGTYWVDESEIDPEKKKKSIFYWGNFVVYADHDALKAAEDEFFNRVTSGGNGSDNGHYPESWSTDISGMVSYAKQLKDEEKPVKEIAKTLMFYGEDGQPVKAINGSEVNIKAVLSEVLDIPEPMIEL